MFLVDGFALGAVVALAVTTVIAMALEPRRLRPPLTGVALLLVFGGSVLAYVAASPWLFLAGWVLTMVPLWFEPDAVPPSARFLLLAGTLVLAAGLILDARQPDSASRTLVFALVAGAALVRQGIVPFHYWVPHALDQGGVTVLNVFLNSQLGLYALVRFGMGRLGHRPDEWLWWLGGLGIVTAIYAGLLAIVAARPRRVLGWLWVSEAAFIVSGLLNGGPEGVTGALVHWWVVSIAMALLLGVYRALEARTVAVERPADLLGLGFHAPRLAVAFVVAILALVGLPGTLGFFAEDLLFHDALEVHPWLGAGLPVAAMLSAIAGLRLFSTLFLGRRGVHVPVIVDARPVERWALAVPMILLMVGGLLPDVVVALRADTAAWIVGLLALR